jgi:LysR family transcriptional regulator, low CO2-responsive transcriptional regulator
MVFFFVHGLSEVKVAPARVRSFQPARRLDMPQSKIRRYLKHGTLPQLSVFEAVARLGNFTRAAEELYMAQPTVSVHIKKLTDTVGMPLFEQVGRKVYLTDAGRHLHAACADIFATLGRVEDGLADLRGLKAGRLRIAVSTTGTYFVPRLLAAYTKANPGVEVSMHVQNRQALLERLGANTDDLYVFANPPTEPDVVTQAILPNPMVAFAAADHPLVHQKHIPFARFAEEPLLIREAGSGTHMTTVACFEKHGAQPNVRMELGSNEAVKQAILAGLGVAIMSRYTLGLDTDRRDLVMLDVEGLPLEGQWYFVYPVGKQPSLVVRSFMDFVREHGKSLVLDHLAKVEV